LLYETGIRRDDPRLANFLHAIRHDEQRKHSVLDMASNEVINENLDRETFKRYVGDAIGIIAKALKKQLVIPDWPAFIRVIGEIFESCRDFNDGNVSFIFNAFSSFDNLSKSKILQSIFILC
ncbi:hypothetical protein WUBG_17820, partial [Wuchereria bancrofti]